MSVEYKIEKNKYQCYISGKKSFPPAELIGLCIDSDTGHCLKYGEAQLVQKWLQDACAAYEKAGHKSMIDCMVFVAGRISPKTLFKVINHGGEYNNGGTYGLNFLQDVQKFFEQKEAKEKPLNESKELHIIGDSAADDLIELPGYK